MVTLTFQDGTLLLEGLPADDPLVGAPAVWDERVARHRAPARSYATVLRSLHRRLPYRDLARAYEEVHARERAPRELRPYQLQALDAWLRARRCGVVVLPTGAGKSYVALRALLATGRATLVLAPTIELVEQWARDLGERLGQEIGQYGGGERRLRPITVATYDSAALFMPFHGNRFGLLICDECHHLPAPVNASAADACLAPYRLGLTATPERADAQHARLVELIGPEVHRSHIHELEGSFLAHYEVELVEVALDPDEQTAYLEARAAYLGFVRAHGIDFSAADAWAKFIAAAARDRDGRAAMRAYREQRRLARASRAKIRALWDVLRQHAGSRTLVFTDDNDTAYAIGRQLVLPVLTHHTRPAERRALLDGFRAGTLPILVTSRVLNEGIDVPEASLGIVVSGSGSVREHVQRLGRLLRPSSGKRAILCEIVSSGTSEAYTSERRSRHAAFGQEEMPWGEAEALAAAPDEDDHAAS